MDGAISMDDGENEGFDVVIIDADSLMYLIAYTQTSPALCKKTLDDKISRIIEDTNAKEAIVLIKGADNFRILSDPDYKANRADNVTPEVRERIKMLYKYSEGFCMTSDGGEADDYCSILAYDTDSQGKTFIVSHIDKDLNSIPGWHHNFKTGVFRFIEPEESYRFVMGQMLTGDNTDNIKGIRGVGPKTAEKIMKGVPSEQLWDHVLAVWKDRDTDWEKSFLKCANCIYIRTTADDMRQLSLDELKDRLTWSINAEENKDTVDVQQPAILGTE